ncbi:MAG TPA: glycosyltransferase family 4 protein, partial [Candidatus Peribacteria bacterium]|nr:glycosyltransferase family 4 protein [Candidatus Peribacteria bacterium]
MSLHSLMFGWEYPPANCGGLGVACQGIVRGLLHHGAKVTLVLPHDQAVEDGIDIVYPHDEQLGSLTVRVPTLLQPYDSEAVYADRLTVIDARLRIGNGMQQLYGNDLGTEVERFTELAVDMTKHVQPDVVHSHDWMTLEAGVRAARHHGRPLFAHVHATELDRTEFKPNDWIYARERSGLLKADHVIAVSDYTRKLLVKEYGIPAAKISVLHNGTFDAVQSAPHRGADAGPHPLVLFLGRLTVQKGAPHFLRAARKVADMRPDVRFVIAGNGYLLPELISQACELGLADKIIFAGKVSSDEAKALYAKASCFVMPSVSEPFGLVALEAITHGAPVVL